MWDNDFFFGMGLVGCNLQSAICDKYQDSLSDCSRISPSHSEDTPAARVSISSDLPSSS